jgi:hypothetical protein
MQRTTLGTAADVVVVAFVVVVAVVVAAAAALDDGDSREKVAVGVGAHHPRSPIPDLGRFKMAMSS